MSGDGEWPQAQTCTHLRDTTVRSRVEMATPLIDVIYTQLHVGLYLVIVRVQHDAATTDRYLGECSIF